MMLVIAFADLKATTNNLAYYGMKIVMTAAKIQKQIWAAVASYMKKNITSGQVPTVIAPVHHILRNAITPDISDVVKDVPNLDITEPNLTTDNTTTIDPVLSEIENSPNVIANSRLESNNPEPLTKSSVLATTVSNSPIPYIHNVFNGKCSREDWYADEQTTHHRLPACHWALEKFPDIFDDEDEDSEDSIPALKLTTPEGDTFYPIDYKNYAKRADRMPLWGGMGLTYLVEQRKFFMRHY